MDDLPGITLVISEDVPPDTVIVADKKKLSERYDDLLKRAKMIYGPGVQGVLVKE